MCRVEERVYVGADGSRQTFEDSYPCHKARRGGLCPKVDRKTTEYISQPAQSSRDDTSTPSSTNPPTPTGTGTYLVQQRRPSNVSRQPSTRDTARVINPAEIIISFGDKKDKTKKYPASKTYSYSSKRSSLGAASTGSNDVAIESPGSDASFTLRTGFPESSIPPNPSGYHVRSAVPQGHQRQTSASSATSSTHTPSLTTPSEPDSPSRRRAPRYPPTLVHNPPPASASAYVPPSPTATRNAAPSSQYRVSIHVPRRSDENVGQDGIFPTNYSEFRHSSGSSDASSGRAAAPEITDRGADRERQRQARAAAEAKKRQEEADRAYAESLERQQETLQETLRVRFDLPHEQDKPKEDKRKVRAEHQYAQAQQRKAEELEREQRRREQERDEALAREARKRESERLKEQISRKEREVRDAESKQRPRRDSRPPTREFNLPASHTKRPGHGSRRNSMSQEDVAERERLLRETEIQMSRERQATALREQEEQAAERAEQLRLQQSTMEYYNPRGGVQQSIPDGLGRRNSVAGRRGSVAGPPPPSVGLSKTNSHRRQSIVHQEHVPPPINTSVAQPTYSTRAPSSYGSDATFSPNNSSQTYNRPPSARHSSYGMENPFAQPSTHIPTTSAANPFATAFSQPPPAVVNPDPWAAPTPMRGDLPAGDPRSLQSRGQQVINEAASRPRGPARQSSQQPPLPPRQHSQARVIIDQPSASRQHHDRARQATRDMGKIVGGYEDDDPGYGTAQFGGGAGSKSSDKKKKRRG